MKYFSLQTRIIDDEECSKAEEEFGHVEIIWSIQIYYKYVYICVCGEYHSTENVAGKGSGKVGNVSFV